jgi:hypothetical protein
MKYWQRQ